MLLVQLPTSFSDIGFVNDVVAFENRSRLVAADLHCDSFIDTESTQAPYAGSANIMEDQAQIFQFLMGAVVLTVSADAIEDTQQAVEANVEKRPDTEERRPTGERYLRTYGVLQALVVQQDAMKDLRDTLAAPHLWDATPVEDIRELRIVSVGHPTLWRKGLDPPAIVALHCPSYTWRAQLGVAVVRQRRKDELTSRVNRQPGSHSVGAYHSDAEARDGHIAKEWPD